MMMTPLRSPAPCFLAVLLCLLSSCSPATHSVPSTTAPTPCERAEIPPTITELQPAQAKAGSQVKVIASGGFFRDSCGGYNESARSYPLYLDGEPAGSMSCYVNHCEGKLQVPEGAAAGKHCLGVQKGTCQMEISVLGD